VDGTVAVVDITGQPAAVQADGQKYRLTVSGAAQYLSVPAGATIAARSIPPLKAPVAESPPPPKDATDLKLFGESVAWKFIKNTGEGSFEVSEADDGKPIGVLHYDFTRSKSRTTPYVMASAAVSVSAGAARVLVYARSPVKQRLTFRVVDSTGQTHQYKGRIDGTGKWERITIPLTRRLEHWGGAKDGKIHYPIQSIVLSVPLPNAEHKEGKVEYADVVTVGQRAAPKPAPSPAKPGPAGPVDLKLFEPGADWQFIKNTGEGSFEVSKDSDGLPIGVLNYDFTRSTTKGIPYVLAVAPVNVVAGATRIRLSARSPVAQKLTFRVKDSTGQTHQYKGKVKGTGKWETITIPLTRRLEHWGGAKDGKIHFPITQLVFSVPLPGEENKTGKVEYAKAIAVMPGGAKGGAAAKPAAAAQLTGPTDLKLFEPGADWQFIKNTGEGSFEVSKDSDGKPIGILTYDFTQSTSKTTPYVLATAETEIPAGATSVRLSARSPIAQKLTFRVKDSTGQTHQYKGKIKGTGRWETITIPLTRRLEHWGGAKDGKIHFPITKLVFSVPLPGEENKTGKVEFADVIAVAPGGS
jgi:hypothetical protein